MPLAFMDNFERSVSHSQSDSQSPQDWDTAQSGGHTHQRKEKNRDAARKSRQKQTEKADELHEELQSLERSSAAYVKEIAELKKEIQIYTTALEQHEPHCNKLCPCGPSVPLTAQGGASTAAPTPPDFTSVPDLNLVQDFEYLSGSPYNSMGVSLTELIDSADWSAWGSVNSGGYLQQF